MSTGLWRRWASAFAATKALGQRLRRDDRVTLPVQRELVFHARQNFQNLEGLGDIIGAADFKRFDLIQHIIQRADENNRNVAGVIALFQAFTDLKAIKPGHLDVEQDQIRRRMLGDDQRQLAAVGWTDLIALLGQDGREHIEVRRRIVDDQNIGLGGKIGHTVLTLRLYQPIQLVQAQIVRQPLYSIREDMVARMDLPSKRLDLFHIRHQNGLFEPGDPILRQHH